MSTEKHLESCQRAVDAAEAAYEKDPSDKQWHVVEKARSTRDRAALDHQLACKRAEAAAKAEADAKAEALRVAYEDAERAASPRAARASVEKHMLAIVDLDRKLEREIVKMLEALVPYHEACDRHDALARQRGVIDLWTKQLVKASRFRRSALEYAARQRVVAARKEDRRAGAAALLMRPERMEREDELHAEEFGPMLLPEADE